MVARVTHPDAAQLQAFNEGRLEDEDASSAIAAHLDTCAECQRNMESLSGDTLENLVRSADTLPGTDGGPGPMPQSLEYFRVEKVLGEGGMGTVYLAEDTRLHRPVALKTLKAELAKQPGAKERFLREARTAAALEHDHVVPIYYVGEADGIPYLAMPVLRGMSLDELLKGSTTPQLQAGSQGAPLSISQAVHIARQIAAGLAAAHARGLIHRDVKPANIWIEPDAGGRVKLLDFGLARAAGDQAHLTASGAILGTPAYMAPEQARGDEVDHRADLFSLGCVLYQMVTGRRPFAGKDTLAVLTSLAVDTPAEPQALNPRCPPELSRLVLQLLEKGPAKRPASAEEVQRRLAQLSPDVPLAIPVGASPTAERTNPWAPGVEPAASSPAAAPDAHAAPRKARRWLTPLIAAGLFALLGGGILLQQIIIRITDKEGKTREIGVKPGEKVEIVQGQATEPANEQTADSKDEVKKFEGTWYYYAREIEGKQRTFRNKDEQLIFSGNRWMETFQGRVLEEGTFTVKEQKPYWVIHYRYTTPKKFEGMHWIAVYRFEGDDTLQSIGSNSDPVLTIGDEDFKRLPKAFETKAEDGQVISTLKRLKN